MKGKGKLEKDFNQRLKKVLPKSIAQKKQAKNNGDEGSSVGWGKKTRKGDSRLSLSVVGLNR